MAIPAWFWPQDGVSAVAVSCALDSSGIVVPDWRQDTFYRFANGAFAPSFSGAALPLGGSGIVPDDAGGTFAVSYEGPLSRIPGGSTAPVQTAMPSGNTYVGISYAGQPFVVTSAGALLNEAGAAVGTGLGLTPAWDLVGNGTTLYTLLAASGEIGSFTASTGVTGAISLPAALATPSCLAVSGSSLAVGGTSNTTLVSGAAVTAFALNPANEALLLGVANGLATIWQSAAPNTFAFSTSLSGIGAAMSAAWTPAGTQALVGNGSAIEVLGFSAGVLSVAQTISVAGAGQVVVLPSGTDAVACQSPGTEVTTLTASGGIWSVSGTVSLASTSGSIVVMSPTQVCVGIPGSLQVLSLVDGAWSLTGVIPLTFTPTSLAVDPQGTLYAAGAGHLAVVQDGAVAGTGAWSGNAGAVSVVADQVAIPDSSIGEIRIFGSDNGTTWTQRSTVAMPGGFTGSGMAASTLFAAGSGAAQLYNFGAPYEVVPVPTGAAGFWNGTAWTTAVLGVGQVPSALTIDASGNAQVATVQNNLYGVTPAGAVTAGIVPQYAGQTQDVPLGTSSLLVSGSSLYATTSMAGVLVQIR